MSALTPVRRLAAAGLVALLALVLAGCGTGSASSSVPPASAAPSAPATVIDTDALLGDASLDGQVVRVAGFFLAAGDTARMCSEVMESYPPQCGGGTVRITGEVPANVLAALESTNDPALARATWGQVQVTGTYRTAGADGRPTIEITEITAAPLKQG